MSFPSLKLRLALASYQALWRIGTPLAARYIARRAQKDADYGQHLAERYGQYDRPDPGGAVWIHAVSLGEFRSTLPLVRLLLERGDRVLISHFTPAGRRESERVLAAEIAADRVRVVWVPFDSAPCLRRFLAAFRPKLGLVMEIEIWPGMIMEARRAHVPLFMCNAQYPSKSFARDKGGLRAELMQGFAGAFVKSEVQRDRFASVGVANIHVTGETRFDQPIPPAHVAAGQAARAWLAPARPVVALASVVAGEDETYLAAIAASLAAHRAQGLPRPLFLYIPRAPERFGEAAALVAAQGMVAGRRRQLFTDDLRGQGAAPDIDLMIGDSLGEMYFYLAMADRALVGGGFTPKGAHNIIEPLAMKKPVMVGPDIHTIEYPAVEAIAAGVCLHLQGPDDLIRALGPSGWQGPPAGAIDGFLTAHSGAAARTIAALTDQGLLL
ncbi:MAG: 3-deoxy-D-manno-octulosonic acid transferase [Rhodobacteraceae bacterium]|nr:3-deoxy-D-manno-octulosonic acid transferase [Paracoccaceae bacterium]